MVSPINRTLVVMLLPLFASCSYMKESREVQHAQQMVLEQQQLLLDEQGEQLNTLLGNHEHLTRQMVVLHNQVEDLYDVLTRPELVPKSDEPAALGQPVLTLESVGTNADSTSMGAENKVLLGRVEWVWLDLARTRYKARIDTGALRSTLQAKAIQPFERNGKKWVRFQMPDSESEKFLETTLVGQAKIRLTSDSELEKWPVVKLMVRLGEMNEEVEFTLSERKMLYTVELGRNFLRDIAIVDVSRKFTQPKVELTTVDAKDK